MLLGCVGHLLQKATSPRSENVTNLQIHKTTNGNLDKTKQQRNMFQTKEQDKTPEELSEVEISNLPKKEFKVMIVKRRRMDAQSKELKFLTEVSKLKHQAH